MTETLEALLTWTPFLAGGFGWNMIVALAAMAIGTPVGILFALMRSAPGWSVRRSGSLLTTIARGAPTFVMLFYLVYIIPERVSLGTVVIVFPIWIKASLALGIAVAGYVSDTALAARHALRRGDMPEALLFLPSWTSYFMIIVMASSTASVIGVPEVVHRFGPVHDFRHANHRCRKSCTGPKRSSVPLIGPDFPFGSTSMPCHGFSFSVAS